MNEQIYGFAACVRPSTQSVMAVNIPFMFNKDDQNDQLKITDYCGKQGALNDGFIPMVIHEGSLENLDMIAYMEEIRACCFGEDVE